MAIQIRDEAGLLNSNDLASLQAAADRWPFDVHIITSTSSANKAAFESRVSAAVDSPNVVAIGVDPTHHTTIVHFGKETGVPASQWAAISSAGNADFKGGHWADGLTSIMNRSLGAKQQAATVTLQPSKTPGSDHTWLWVTGGVILGLAAIIGVYYWMRARRQAAERQRQLDLEDDLLSQKVSRNREEREWADKFRERAAPKMEDTAPRMEDEVSRPRARSAAATSSPSPKPKKLVWGEPVVPYRHVSPAPPVVVNNTGNSNDLALGYVLGRMDSPGVVGHVHEEPRRVHHEPASSWGSSDDAGGSSSSFGSSSSSYDSGGSSSSWSSDSGGSSSSFDSGGSSDSGGGSSDW